MTAHQHSTAINDETATVSLETAHVVINILLEHMKPKRERAARRQIDRYLAQLETFDGQQLPLGVTPIRRRQCDEPSEQIKRQRLAAALRLIAEPVGAETFR